jgi:hypothetical protein
VNSRPIRRCQTVNFGEVMIPGGENPSVVKRDSGYPHVVLGQRAPLYAETMPQASVFTRDVKVAGDDGTALGESFEPGGVFRGTSGMGGAVEQLAEYNGGYEQFRSPFRMEDDGFLRLDTRR